MCRTSASLARRGCNHGATRDPAGLAAWAAAFQPAIAALHPGDILDIVIFDHPELSGSATVSKDGFVSVPLIGRVRAVGTEPDGLARRIELGLGKYLYEPAVDVRVRRRISSSRVHGVRPARHRTDERRGLRRRDLGYPALNPLISWIQRTDELVYARFYSASQRLAVAGVSLGESPHRRVGFLSRVPRQTKPRKRDRPSSRGRSRLRMRAQPFRPRRHRRGRRRPSLCGQDRALNAKVREGVARGAQAGRRTR